MVNVQLKKSQLTQFLKENFLPLLKTEVVLEYDELGLYKRESSKQVYRIKPKKKPSVFLDLSFLYSDQGEQIAIESIQLSYYHPISPSPMKSFFLSDPTHKKALYQELLKINNLLFKDIG